MAAVEVAVFVEQGGNIKRGVEEEGVEEGAVDVGAFGGAGQGAAEFGEGFVVEGLFEEECAEVGAEFGGVWLLFEHSAVEGDRLVGLADLAEEFGEDGLNVGDFREELGGAFCVGEGVGDFVLTGEGDAEGVVGFAAVGGELGGSGGGGDGVFVFTRAVEGGGEGGVEVAVEGECGGCGLEVFDGVVQTIDVRQRDAEVALGVGVVGVELEGLFEGGDGLVVAAGDAEGDAEVGVGFGEGGVGGEEVAVELDGFVGAFGVEEDSAEGEGEGGLRGEGDSAADEAFGFGEGAPPPPSCRACLVGDHAEEVEGVGLVGVDLEDLAVDLFGVFEVAGVLVAEGELEGVVDGELGHGSFARGGEKCAGRGSNPQPSASEADALSN